MTKKFFVLIFNNTSWILNVHYHSPLHNICFRVPIQVFTLFKFLYYLMFIVLSTCQIHLHVSDVKVVDGMNQKKIILIFSRISLIIIYIVVYLFKATTVKPEKQPLLANGSETTFVSRQRPRNKQGNTSVARQQILDKQQLNGNRGGLEQQVQCSAEYQSGKRRLRVRIRSRKGAAAQRGLEHANRGIAIVRNRYQEKPPEDTAGWKRFSVCCSD
jgi:hypothetical protein